MPDIDVMVQLSHTKKRRSVTKRKSQSHAISKCARRQPIIFRIVLPFQQECDVGTIVHGAYRQRVGCRLRPDGAGNDLAAQWQGHRGDFLPERIFRRHGYVSRDGLRTDDHAFGTDNGDTETTQNEGEKQQHGEETQQSGAGCVDRRHSPHVPARGLSRDNTRTRSLCGSLGSVLQALPQLGATNLIFTPLANIQISLGVERQAHGGIHHRLNSEQPVPVFERAGRIFRDKAGSAAATHILIILS